MTSLANRACVVALCLAAACTSSEDKTDPTVVKLADGSVQGVIVGNDTEARAFLGIPYAKPPVGDLRWKAPQKPDPWKDVRSSLAYGKRCAQLENRALQNAASTDEDCLYLNVWTPYPVAKTALPVMIWMHGGGNVNGSTSEPLPFINSGVFYDGQFLAANHGVVIVSMNYRLGVFGFFAHPDLAAEGTSGNQGLLDQQMAFQWVHDNIARFGGDPSNVTIFGESAGSFDACMHVAAPSNAGLFHRAISESGGCTTVQRTKAQAETAGTAFATNAGCTGAGQLACLRGKSATDVMALPDVAAGRGFGPDVDGKFMPDQPRTLYDTGKILKVPYLLGSNTDEGTLFLTARPTTQEEYTGALNAMFCGGPTTTCAQATAVAAQYNMTNAEYASALPNAATAALARVIGDSRLVCTTFDSAQRMAKTGAPVFMYNFDIPVPSLVVPPGVFLGATHGSELTSVFGTSPTFAADAQAKAASDLIQRYWTNFAKTGDPNGGTDPKWPAFTDTANVRMNFALQPSVVTNFRADKCAFWQAGYALQFP